MISYVWRPQLICSLPVYRVGLCSWSNHLKLAEMPLIDKHPHCAPWLHTLWVKLLSCYKCSLFHTTSTGSGQRDEVLGSQAPSTTVIYHAIAHHVPFSCSPTTSSHSLHMTLSCSFSLLELDIDCQLNRVSRALSYLAATRYTHYTKDQQSTAPNLIHSTWFRQLRWEELVPNHKFTWAEIFISKQKRIKEY